jgi:hypothetical protein
LVAVPRFAALERSAAVRLLAADRPCRDSAEVVAAACPSRFNARVTARERRGFGDPSAAPPRLDDRAARRCVFVDVDPVAFLG